MPILARLARAHLPGRTVRLRLTLLYGGLFLLSGFLLLAITYVLFQHAITGQFKSFVPAGGGQPPPGAAPLSRGELAILSRQAEELMRSQQASVLKQLLAQSGIALAITSVVSMVLGWLVAGRVLRRLRTITITARRISATDLHQRLALDGPTDELKELGDTIDGLLARLEAAFEAQRRFIANASHELRTPLARQRALGQLALSDPDATAASLRRAHERVLAAGVQQERLIEALLTLARGQAGIKVGRPVDLAEIAGSVAAAKRPDADVPIRTRLHPAVVPGHPPLLERLLVNLVDNALRYNTEDGWAEITTGRRDDAVVLTVTNTGPPVPPAAVERLFQPFERLDPRRAGRPDGLGLGLSIVAAIATAHQATITAVARPAGGLAIEVTFRLSDTCGTSSVD
ncbi:Signal transduction histidine kinase [Amycolatopsis pretoriensis]|uniref:histidine kinase n=2 Tax=Amycolatopsis pretoriensis TaxID=218821 RepID=A0A1H5R1M8_9PSEU|nr:ATP-binding protein [Amycolatopsis pretoriensis]SEF32302.1 Signal transduction histidine kinase [Amycolatopsis pretoriensis]